MENKRAVYISLGSAALAVVIFFMFVEKRVENETSAYRDKQVVIVAAMDIPPNTRIDRSMLLIRDDWPRSLVPPDTAQSFLEVENQVAIATIKQGEPIMRTKIVPFDESSLNRRLRDGYRAITIGIRDDQDVVGVGGNLRPGMFVDILLTLFINTREIEKGPVLSQVERESNLRAETRTIFQNVKILAVGRDARLQTANVTRPVSFDEELANKNVTVEMLPQDVQKLVLAQSVGRLVLSLRPANDSQILPLEYLDAFKAFGIKLPIVSGPPPAYREIRGGQVFAAPF
jgi:Flp pilus assembly protein CpaB